MPPFHFFVAPSLLSSCLLSLLGGIGVSSTFSFFKQSRLLFARIFTIITIIICFNASEGGKENTKAKLQLCHITIIFF